MPTAIENNPIIVHLPDAANLTGWSQDGVIATHTACNSGYITNLSYTPIAGHTYQVSYVLPTITGGLLRCEIGTAQGASQTGVGLHVETIVAAGSSPQVRFFSDANCTLTKFNIRDITDGTGATIVYSIQNAKWSDRRLMYPDWGLSLFERTITMYNGDVYTHQNGTADSRNNFYGVQHQSSIKFVENKNSATIKAFQSLNYQANTLFITTTDGITTSLGQVSELIDTDFLKDTLNDGISQVNIYDKDSVYAACFLRDKNEDINTGSPLRGNWAMIELITVDGSAPVILFTAQVETAQIKIGSR